MYILFLVIYFNVIIFMVGFDVNLMHAFYFLSFTFCAKA